MKERLELAFVRADGVIQAREFIKAVGLVPALVFENRGVEIDMSFFIHRLGGFGMDGVEFGLEAFELFRREKRGARRRDECGDRVEIGTVDFTAGNERFNEERAAAAEWIGKGIAGQSLKKKPCGFGMKPCGIRVKSLCGALEFAA